jgi:hypothetical protein
MSQKSLVLSSTNIPELFIKAANKYIKKDFY